MTPTEVVFHHRRPVSGHHSVEGYFAQVREHLPPDIHARVETCRFVSRGLFRRLANMVGAFLQRGEVDHVTGDVHYLVLALSRSRTVLTVLDCEPLDRLRGIRRWIMLWLWYRLPVRRAAAVTVISEATRADLLRHVRVDPARVRVVPVSISEEFAPAPRAFDEARPRILQVGTAHNKNLLRLAEALRDVPCHLDVVGRLTEEQRAALARNGVSFEASSDLTIVELVERYRRADLLAFASTYEGFGMPILEAQAVGRPVVTSDLLSMPEVAGGAACLVDPFDVASIRGGILRVIEDREYREGLVAAGRENVRRFDARAIAEQYAGIYRSLAGRTPDRKRDGVAA